MLKLALALLGLLVAIDQAPAQQAHGYAGLEQRRIKALSEQQVADLRAGRGMGLAFPAELNGYPGPLHALELADRIGLSEEQSDRMRALFEAMKADAVPLGERLIEQEAHLDDLFASKRVTAEALAAATGAIGATQGALRNAHLKYHLAAAEILKPDQIRRYAELRGYASHPRRHGHD